MEHSFPIKQNNASPVPQIANFEILLFFSRGEILYQIIQKKSKSTPPLPLRISPLDPWLDTLKLERNPKFPELHFFNHSELGLYTKN